MRVGMGLIKNEHGIYKRSLGIDNKNSVFHSFRHGFKDALRAAGVNEDVNDALKDINTTIDVDPDEAQRLIELTELLFEEWYEARQSREQRLIKIGAIAAEKALAKTQVKEPEPDQATVAEEKPRVNGNTGPET